MAARDIIQAAGGSAATSAAVYVEDVFSSWLRTGTGASSTVTNNIDIQTNGGLVITKSRSAATSWRFTDKSRGATYSLDSSSTASQATDANGLTAFTTSGYTVGSDTNYNNTGATYVDFAFRKQPKFFDVVTYTGTGSARTIAHSLGATPGMIIVKPTDTTGYWYVYHRSLTSGHTTLLNVTDAAFSSVSTFTTTAPTSSVFSLGNDTAVNGSGGSYVAYLFAHNAGGFGPAGTDSVVACGSFTTDGSGNATVNLGWEAQYVLVKNVTSAESWYIQDQMRGMSETSLSHLWPNTSAAEQNSALPFYTATSTGFKVQNNTASKTYIYLAIRRGPMKTPTDATKVFAPVIQTPGSFGSRAGRIVNAGFTIDAVIASDKNNTWVFNHAMSCRLTEKVLQTSSANSEANYGVFGGFDVQNGVYDNFLNSNPAIYWNFRRVPGFFDVVCYTGTGGSQTVTHNLGVAPELMIFRCRNGADDWYVSSNVGLVNKNGYLNYISAFSSTNYGIASPTSNSVTANSGNTNALGNTYVAYLFATCPGVSKVFSYTGNGSSQTINCGFTAGARFVLIKRTDSTGDWYVWDTARGIVSANDPHLSLNTTAAEVTTNDTIDTAGSGFIVNQVAATNVNVNNATYIGLAIA